MFRVTEPEANYRVMVTYGTQERPEWFIYGFYRWKFPAWLQMYVWILFHPWGGAELQGRVEE